MGGSSSKDEKSIDSNGNVNNNVILKDEANGSAIYEYEIMIILLIICIIKIIEFIYFVYAKHQRTLKKKYTGSGLPTISSNSSK